jgi:uncharacterized membrane protein
MRAAVMWYCCAVGSLIGLIFLTLAWELWLAPLRPEGSFLAFKSAVLLLPLFGILRGKIYTYQWSCMLSLFYLAEGVVRSYADTGVSARLALIEAMLAAIFFASSILYIRRQRRTS